MTTIKPPQGEAPAIAPVVAVPSVPPRPAVPSDEPRRSLYPDYVAVAADRSAEQFVNLATLYAQRGRSDLVDAAMLLAADAMARATGEAS